MPVRFIHDKQRLETFLLRYPTLNFYHLGDLDDFFWPYTSWLALEAEQDIQALGLLYVANDPAVLLAIVNDNEEAMRQLLRESLFLLPARFYSHLSPGLEEVLRPHYRLSLHGEHYKMGLTNPDALADFDTSGVQRLTGAHLDELRMLYAASYPGNWFDPRMLETGQYVGLRDEDGRLVCVAGIHVYSPVYKIAALGNITTLPERRGQGLATITAAGLCKQLLQTVEHIGLNVRSDNAAAIRAYQKIGFESMGVYNEWMADPLNIEEG